MSARLRKWGHLTPDMIRHPPQTRKKWLKFRKRFRKQHGGHNFCWYQVVYKQAIFPYKKDFEVVMFHRRQDNASLDQPAKISDTSGD